MVAFRRLLASSGSFFTVHLVLLVTASAALTCTAPASAAVPERNVYYTYDVMGRQLTAKFDSASGADGITNTYNGFGDQLTSTISMAGFSKTVTSAYDGAGRRTQVTHPDAQAFTYAYDNLSRLSGVYQGVGTAAPLDTFGYGNNGLVSSRSEAGGSSVAYGWDDVGRLTSQSDAFSDSVNNVGWTFSLNPASQIASETRTNDGYAWTGTVDVSRGYTVNGLNQYVVAGPASFTYDSNGSLTSDGTATYSYDVENRLVKAVAGSVTTNLTYDPLGRLFQVDKGTSATTTKFVYDGDALVLEFNGSNAAINRYVHGSNAAADDPLVWYSGATVSSTTRRWLHADHLGSIVAVTNSSGGSPSINAYDEYGIPQTDATTHNINLNTGRFQYTGQAWIGELGMYYYKARIYSPKLGRFLQTDPIGYDGGINLYGYVGNDPVGNVDPEGTRCAALNAGSVYCLRRDIYDSFDRRVNAKTRFFAAAARTAEYLANNDLPVLGNVISDQAEKFLNDVSSNLYAMNAREYMQILNGTLTGKDLDSKLVHIEQSKVQAMLNSLPTSQRDAIVGSINRAFNSSLRSMSGFLSSTDREYNRVLNGVEKSLGRSIDFGRQSDREAIGNALIKNARDSGDCSQIGSRIPSC